MAPCIHCGDRQHLADATGFVGHVMQIGGKLFPLSPASGSSWRPQAVAYAFPRANTVAQDVWVTLFSDVCW